MNNTIKKQLKLEEQDYYEKHLSIINSMLPIKMTKKEIVVLAAFMSIKGDLAINRFGPQCKKLVMQRANLSPAGLSNFLKGLKEKKFLFEENNVIKILQVLIPNDSEQTYIFKISKNG